MLNSRIYVAFSKRYFFPKMEVRFISDWEASAPGAESRRGPCPLPDCEAPVVTSLSRGSPKQYATYQIVHRRHDALKVVPPDHRWQLHSRLEHRYDHAPEHGQAVIFLHVSTTVVPYAILQQDGMVMVKQCTFQSLPTFWIPVHGHH